MKESKTRTRIGTIEVDVKSHYSKVICLGNRFFYGFGKNKSVQTAWTLTGATLFLHLKDIKKVTDILDSKKKKYEVYVIKIFDTFENIK
jgi:hypothetical protein